MKIKPVPPSTVHQATEKKMKTPALKLGTWNVRTMTPGFSDNLQEVNDARKTAVIDRELRRLQMHIVALQGTRLPETGSVRERDFTLFWQGKPSNEVREHGVAFAVRNKLLGSITPPAEGTERIRLSDSKHPHDQSV